jgi:2,4-dienoyl-CoA reductase (NADPH2)
VVRRAAARKQLAVVGAGPAGLAAAVNLAARGHTVTLYESAGEIGGQFNLAKRIPGKEEFRETLRYFGRQLELLEVIVKLNTAVTAAELAAGGYDEVVLATGVRPRIPAIPGIDHPSVLSYVDVIMGAPVGRRVAVLGAGGIGFDVSVFLTHASLDREGWLAEWGSRIRSGPGPGSRGCGGGAGRRGGRCTCCSARRAGWVPGSARPAAGCIGWHWSTSGSR